MVLRASGRVLGLGLVGQETVWPGRTVVVRVVQVQLLCVFGGFQLSVVGGVQATVRGFVSVGTSAIGFGVLPVLVVWGAAAGLNVTTLLVLRFVLTAALLPLLCSGCARGPRPELRTLGGLFVLGVLFALQSVLYLLAVERISPGPAVLLHYLYPVFVLVLSAALRQGTCGARIVLPLVIALAGLVLTVGELHDVDLAGLLCGLGCALVYAVYVVLGTRLSVRVGAQRLTMYVVFFSAVALVAFAWPSGSLDLDFRPLGWAVVAVIAVVSTAMPIALFFAGSKVLGATQASVLSMLEPVVGVLAAWTVLGAGLTTLQLIGGIVLLAGAILSVYAPYVGRNAASPARRA